MKAKDFDLYKLLAKTFGKKVYHFQDLGELKNLHKKENVRQTKQKERSQQ